MAQREVLHHARLDVYSIVAKLSSLNKVDMQEQMDGFQASKLQEEKEKCINPGPDREISIWCNLLTSSLLAISTKTSENLTRQVVTHEICYCQVRFNSSNLGTSRI